MNEDSWLDETIRILLLAFAGVYSIFFGQVLDPATGGLSVIAMACAMM
jgi:hypothetical protein